jgi:hypothetical protein
MTAKETAKQILAKVKAVFAEPVAPIAPVIAAAPAVDPNAPPAAAGIDCPLADGRVMTCTPDMSPGATCTIDGAPTPVGEYPLADGSTVSVVQEGIIAEVEAAEPMTTNVPPQPTVEERLAKLEEAITKLSMPVAPVLPTGLATEVQLQEATAQIEKQGKVIEGLFELVETIAETPTAEPATLTANKKDQFEKSAAKEKRFENIGNSITQLKNKNK